MSAVLKATSLVFASAAALLCWVIFSPPAVKDKFTHTTSRDQTAAAIARLTQRIPGVKINFDNTRHAPKDIRSLECFLTAPHSGNDPHQAVKSFLNDYADLFGFDSRALKSAEVKRDYVNAHNGMRTVVFAQQVDGVPVYGAQILASISAHGELIHIGSTFVPDVSRALDSNSFKPAASMADPSASASRALDRAIQTLVPNSAGIPSIAVTQASRSVA